MTTLSSSGTPPDGQHGDTTSGNYLDNFKNLLGPGMSDLTDMTKRYAPAFPYQKDNHVTPAEIKKLVMASERIQTMIEKVWHR